MLLESIGTRLTGFPLDHRRVLDWGMTDDIPGSDLGRVQDLLEGLLHRLRGHDGQGHGGLFGCLLSLSPCVSLIRFDWVIGRVAHSIRIHPGGRRRVNVAVIDDGGRDG